LWARVTDDAWDSIVANPPERLGVVLKDLPEEKTRRKYKNAEESGFR